jgi:P pilus assembly chaperone PapD
MKRATGSLLGLLLALFATQGMAAGVLKLSRTELKLEPGKPARELYVENTGDTSLYLDVEQQLLVNPGQAPERLIPIQYVELPSLLVTPTRLVLAPGQKHKMVISELKRTSSPLVWRVTFRPRERLVIDADSTSAPLVVSIGYGVVIFQPSSDCQTTEAWLCSAPGDLAGG